MSVQSEIDRIITAVGNAYSKVSEKGGTVPASQTVANLATAIDSIPSGGAKETWVLNETLGSHNKTYTINFTSNNNRYTTLTLSPFVTSRLKYGDTLVYGNRGSQGSGWINQAYRKLTFDTPPTGALLTWLQANGVKQPDDTAVQDTKAVTITSNGTVSVTPDAPYDGLSSVDVTVNVSGGGGSFETCTLTTSVGKAPGIAHGTIYAYYGDTLITITSKGTYSINKNSLIYIDSAASRDEVTGLEKLCYFATKSVCNVTSDIATYKFNG